MKQVIDELATACLLLSHHQALRFLVALGESDDGVVGGPHHTLGNGPHCTPVGPGNAGQLAPGQPVRAEIQIDQRAQRAILLGGGRPEGAPGVELVACQPATGRAHRDQHLDVAVEEARRLGAGVAGGTGGDGGQVHFHRLVLSHHGRSAGAHSLPGPGKVHPPSVPGWVPWCRSGRTAPRESQPW